MAKSSTKWYPYPQEKPHYEGDYSVYLIDEGEIYESVSLWIPQLDKFFAETDMIVVAWAAPPELCEETNDSERAD